MCTWKNSLIIAALTTGFLVSACATPTIVQEQQLGDDKLSCYQLQSEITEARRFEQAARDERGVTGTNVAAVLFFWPALLVTYSNASDAIEAAQNRQRNLQQIYSNKNC